MHLCRDAVIAEGGITFHLPGSVSMCVQVVLYCFDCLYLDGEVLLRKPLRDRREAMYRSIIPEEGKVQFATAKTSRDIDELQVCFDLGCVGSD